jgi:hypothetical protein
MKYACCDDRRREAVKAHGTLNGIDFLEVQDDPADPDQLRQRTLFVHFIKDLPADAIGAANVHISGGERLRKIVITDAFTAGAVSPPLSLGTGANLLVVQVAAPGDFSTYTLRIDDVGSPLTLDPLLSSVDFSFKVGCASPLDCDQPPTCPLQEGVEPELNYLAKDYGSFRQLMLDRLAALAPAWTERNPADIGVTLVELLAYVADYLSYQQDAVGTEAYLRTARLRTSVRRHARLIDYRVHEGSNARAWVQIAVADGVSDLPLDRKSGDAIARVITRSSNTPVVMTPDSREFSAARLGSPEEFELVRVDPKSDRIIQLYADHNLMRFYTWGALACCLPAGATSATLRGALPHLTAGLVLIFQEARGPLTGVPGDADPAHRHAVRLARVTLSSDPLGGRFETPATDAAVPVTEIEWSVDDALPFPLCISARQGDAFFDDVSVALGNIALVDHGVTVDREPLPPVPPPNPALTRVANEPSDRCGEREERVTPARYRPALALQPLTHAPDYALALSATSASSVMRWPMTRPLPAISLDETDERDQLIDRWQPLDDLLASAAEAKAFVVEVENDGTASLRFGDDQFGARPKAVNRLSATYRVGNGTAGNVGRETLAHLVTADTALLSDVITRVWNPLPAQGGVEPESIESVRQRAPSAFMVQDRAVSPRDYEDIVKRCSLGVQRAAATFRWTGSWRTVFITADRTGGAPVDAQFAADLQACVEPFRMAGLDLHADEPIFVPLEIAMSVCVDGAYFASHVKHALLAIFTSGFTADGKRGLFHPDNFTFGQPVYLSPLFAAAQSVAGVTSVRITTFQRRGRPETQGIDTGKLTFEALEIPRLDNDRNFPDRGTFSLTTEGGR